MKSSLYGQYIFEREGFEIVEDEFGFASYFVSGEECYIRDIFVKADHRNENHASKYADQIAAIAKERGCKVLTGTVAPLAKGSTASLKVLLSYGFKLHSSNSEKIIFIKEIS